jgi:hypothetical protein
MFMMFSTVVLDNSSFALVVALFKVGKVESWHFYSLKFLVDIFNLHNSIYRY